MMCHFPKPSQQWNRKWLNSSQLFVISLTLMICSMKCRTASKSRRLTGPVSIETPSQQTRWAQPLLYSPPSANELPRQWSNPLLSSSRAAAAGQWATQGWEAGTLHSVYFSRCTMHDLRLGLDLRLLFSSYYYCYCHCYYCCCCNFITSTKSFFIMAKKSSLYCCVQSF